MIKYSSLKWTEVEDALSEKWLILPLGSMEQHGRHLPLGVDTILAKNIARDVAVQVGAVVAPVISYGARSVSNSGGGSSYPGTIRIPGDLMIPLYTTLIEALVSSGGATKIAIINGHWENEPFMVEAIEQCNEMGVLEGVNVVALSWWSVVEDRQMLEIFGRFDGWHVEHASQAETALMLSYAPDLVDMSAAGDCNEPIPAGIYRYPVPDEWKGNDGVLGRTSGVNIEKGNRLRAIIVEKIVNLLAQRQFDKI